MPNTHPAPQAIARAYFEAMASKNVEGILAVCDENIICDSPLGHVDGIQHFRGFHEGFARMIDKLTLKAVHGDEKQAVVIYVADTLPVKGAFVAEYLTIAKGKINSARVIYDGTPFAQYAASAQAH
jgi:hypothetical protein